MKTFILIFLIIIEAAFITASYFKELEWMAIVPAGVYVSLAIADTIASDKRFSVLVVFLSVAIAIPRIFIKYSELSDKTANVEASVVENVPIPPVYVPVIQNCDNLNVWDMAVCQKNNLSENRKKNERDVEIYNAKMGITVKSNKIRANSDLSVVDVGMLFLFIVLSVSIPSGIFFLMHPPPPEMTDDEKFLNGIAHYDDMEKCRLLLEAGWDWKQTAKTSKIVENHVGISRATYYRRLRKNEKKTKPNLIILNRRDVV